MPTSSRTFIIAEAGVNHGGSLDRALRLVDIAADSGADAVKFQTFQARELATPSAGTAAYQAAAGYRSQLQMLSALELAEADFQKLERHSQSRGIAFLSTAFDLGSVELLRRLGMSVWKIPSGEITNAPLVEAIGSIAGEVIMSTGMATLDEIDTALGWLEGAGCSRDRVTVLQCSTEYPTSFEHANLRAMQTIGSAFGVRVGYSDHTIGIEACIAAVAVGATVIEKHFTEDRDLPGPDHKISLVGTELKAMIDAIRNIELALGDGEKRVTGPELTNRPLVRKGIYAARPIAEGERFTAVNLVTRRPEAATPASEWHRLIGRTAPRSFAAGEPIKC